MIEKYIYSDGKIIAQNEDEMYIHDYQDNIEDLLSTQNIIESLEKKKKLLNTDMRIAKSDLKSVKNFRKSLFVIAVVFFLLSFSALAVSGASIIPSFLISLLGPIYASLCSFSIINQIKKIKNRINGNTLKLENVEKQLEEYKDKLIELENDKTNIFESVMPVHTPVDLNYKDKLIELTRLLNLYYKIGYNEEKLDKYYENGSLEQKLENNENFKKEDYQLVKKYFDNKKKTTI